MASRTAPELDLDSAHATAFEGPISRMLGKAFGSRDGQTHEMAGTMASNIAKSIVSNAAPRIGDFAAKVGPRIGIGEEKSRNAAQFAWQYGVYAVPFVSETFKNTRTVYRNYAEEAQRFDKLIGGGRKPRLNVYSYLTSDLEVVQNRRQQMRELPRALLRNTLMSTVNNAFMVADSWLTGKIMSAGGKKNKSREPQTKEEVLTALGRQDTLYGNLGFAKSVLDNEAVAGGLRLVGKNVDFEGFEETYSPDDSLTSLKRLMRDRRGQLENLSTMMGGLAKVVAPLIVGKVKDNGNTNLHHKFTKQDAAEMILVLQKSLQEDPNRLEIKAQGGAVPIEQYVENIFHQHERDCGRGEVKGLALTQLRHASASIVEAMRNPNVRLHPQALGVLVDSRRGITRRASGQAKHPIETVITGHDLHKQLYALRDQGFCAGKAESAETYFGKADFDAAELQQLFEKLDPEDRSIIGSFFPDAALLKAGVPVEEVHQLRLEGLDLWDSMITQMLSGMQPMIETGMLEGSGLTATDVEFLGEVMQQNIRGNRRYLEENRSDITRILANYGMAQERGTPGFWQEMVGNAKVRPQAHAEHQSGRREPVRQGLSPDRFRRGSGEGLDEDFGLNL